MWSASAETLLLDSSRTVAADRTTTIPNSGWIRAGISPASSPTHRRSATARGNGRHTLVVLVLDMSLTLRLRDGDNARRDAGQSRCPAVRDWLRFGWREGCRLRRGYEGRRIE